VAGSAEADTGFIPMYPDAWLYSGEEGWDSTVAIRPRRCGYQATRRVSGALVELVIVRP
jgi:hypothetical protein